MSLARVDLPEPEAPTMPMIWPAGMCRFHVVQDLGAVEPIAEGDLIEHDVAADRRKRRPRRVVGRLGRGVEDVAEARNRDARLMESCHRCARRSTGCATRPASMLKAMSSPTVSLPSMTR